MKTSVIDIAAALLAGISMVCSAQTHEFAVADLSGARLKSATAMITTFDGSTTLKLNPMKPGEAGYASGGPMAILPEIQIRNGTIEADVAGAPAKDADDSARGFIGIAFRIQSESRFEIIYLRPTNSHADDQLRRNHTTQYSSEPDWPWDRLRKESPGVYESWVDIEAGKWTHMLIVVHGASAALYINQAENPCLVVHDLKLGDVAGSVGLWMGQDTEGYFRKVRLTPE